MAVGPLGQLIGPVATTTTSSFSSSSFPSTAASAFASSARSLLALGEELLHGRAVVLPRVALAATARIAARVYQSFVKEAPEVQKARCEATRSAAASWRERSFVWP